MRTVLRTLPVALALLATAACKDGPGDAVTPAEDPAAAPAGPSQSIIRDDVRTVPIEDELVVPMELTVGFGASDTLSADAGRAIDAFLGEERLAGDDPITLFGHSDSIGSDEANERASRERAQVVADYLEEKGVAADRITIVALGEHNPVAPNLMLDGGDDEAGQARNRRVEIAIGSPAQVAERRAAMSAERRAEEEEAGLDDDAPAEVPAASTATSETRRPN